MKPVRTWILLADGAHARVLLNEGPGKGVHQIKGADINLPHPEASSANADRPGRVHESYGTTRHAVDAGDLPGDTSKRMFAKDLATNLTSNSEKFDRLVIVAAPETLGTLRHEISDDVEAKVHATIPKDLTTVPTDKIAGFLGDTIVV